MEQNRRDFLRIAGTVTAGLLLSGNDLLALGSSEAGKVKRFGLQLWTLRDDLPKDPKGVLKQLAAMGYKQIESFEGTDGMFWGMGPAGFKQYMDELGMTLVASHCNMNQDFEKKAAEAAAVGMKYLVCPWLGPQPTLDHFKKSADLFNKCGEICRKEGLRFAYHNHDYSFKEQEGQLPQDVLMNYTDAALVDFEMDIYWVVTGGHDPEAWMKKYKNRFRLCHIKDRSKSPVADNGKNSVDLGTGVIDFKKVLKTAKANGMKYFIVEQEAYPGGSALEAVKADAKFMKQLKL
jgi:sugar phosphate isomerase/epimerase